MVQRDRTHVTYDLASSLLHFVKESKAGIWVFKVFPSKLLTANKY